MPEILHPLGQRVADKHHVLPLRRFSRGLRLRAQLPPR
jgi:hypothetical protein